MWRAFSKKVEAVLQGKLRRPLIQGPRYMYATLMEDCGAPDATGIGQGTIKNTASTNPLEIRDIPFWARCEDVPEADGAKPASQPCRARRAHWVGMSMMATSRLVSLWQTVVESDCHRFGESD